MLTINILLFALTEQIEHDLNLNDKDKKNLQEL